MELSKKDKKVLKRAAKKSPALAALIIEKAKAYDEGKASNRKAQGKEKYILS